MAAIRRNPVAAGVVILLVGCLVVFGVFLTLLRSIGSDPSPGLPGRSYFWAVRMLASTQA